MKPLTLTDRIAKCLKAFGPMNSRQLANVTGATLAVTRATISRLSRAKKITAHGNSARYGKAWSIV